MPKKETEPLPTSRVWAEYVYFVDCPHCGAVETLGECRPEVKALMDCPECGREYRTE